MAKRINFPELPVVEGQGGDTIAAYRDGQVVRIAVPSAGGGGTVTSVAVSAPTGFVVANSPVTSSGTIQITFDSGYGLPTTVAMGQWATSYGWGNHASAGYASASAVASALAGKVDTSDSRLTNSREWTASTVGQVEAEAGTATTRRAWTAQRVWQAITAWWNASAAKDKLDNIQAGATANQTDAYLLNRANHTGTQAASTITGLATVATTGSYNDLTGKPSIPAGTVTSVGLSAPTGFSVSGSPVTGGGTLALAFASGYSLPTTAKQGQWDQAYGWGNHAAAGYAASDALNAYLPKTGGTLTGPPVLNNTYLESSDTWGMKWKFAGNSDTVSMDQASTSWLFNIAGGGVTKYRFNASKNGFGPIVDFGTDGSATFYGNLNVNGDSVATEPWVNAQLADLGGDVKVWIATTGALTKNAFHKVAFTANRTLTLPASPAANDFVEIYADGGNATGSTIARNGQTIMGLAENLSLDAPLTHIRFVYSGTTWRIAS